MPYRVAADVMLYLLPIDTGKSPERLTRNEYRTVFRVISMRWLEAAWFVLVGQKICCVISVASIL
jgi:hypothetical protein